MNSPPVSLRPRQFADESRGWDEKFCLNLNVDSDFDVTGLDPLYAAGANSLLMMYPEISHLIFMQDDFLYNPEWLHQLDGLIHRHPEATAWTVYRSSHDQHHKILMRDSYGDCLVTSIAGIGTMTKEEWLAYGLTGKDGGYHVPAEAGGGDTIDLHHAYKRQGQRWATGRDYWEGIGTDGIHASAGVDRALDFVGE